MRTYDINFKQEAIKLTNEICRTKAGKELNIPAGTLDSWIAKAKAGVLAGKPATPQNALSLAEENKKLRQENKDLKRVNEILSKATAFFAQSQKM